MLGRRGERGAALVEMALVIPTLLVLIFGVTDMGLMLKDYLALNQVAREAARSAALGSSASTVRAQALKWAQTAGLDVSLLWVEIEYTAPQTGGSSPPSPGQVVVTAYYPHKFLMGSFLSLPDAVRMRTAVVMRRE